MSEYSKEYSRLRSIAMKRLKRQFEGEKLEARLELYKDVLMPVKDIREISNSYGVEADYLFQTRIEILEHHLEYDIGKSAGKRKAVDNAYNFLEDEGLFNQSDTKKFKKAASEFIILLDEYKILNFISYENMVKGLRKYYRHDKNTSRSNLRKLINEFFDDFGRNSQNLKNVDEPFTYWMDKKIKERSK